MKNAILQNAVVWFCFLKTTTVFISLHMVTALCRSEFWHPKSNVRTWELSHDFHYVLLALYVTCLLVVFLKQFIFSSVQKFFLYRDNVDNIKCFFVLSEYECMYCFHTFLILFEWLKAHRKLMTLSKPIWADSSGAQFPGSITHLVSMKA